MKELAILFADDKAIIRESFKKLTERFYSKIQIAQDGVEAYELYQRGDFDLLITDITMPNMKGDELIEKIRQNDKEIAIFVCSGYVDLALYEKLRDLDVSVFLQKPFSSSDIFDNLDALYKKKKVNIQ